MTSKMTSTSTMTKYVVVALALLLGMSLVNASGVLAQPPTPQQSVQGRYIVVLNDDISDLGRVASQGAGSDPGRIASRHANQHAAQLDHVYRNAIKGYSAEIPEKELEAIKDDPRVDYVEPDGVVRVTAQTIPWGIKKVGANLSSTRAGNGSGAVSNVHVYVIDTGIYKHADLNVVKHINFTGDGKNRDCHGHGTHVAGTVAARDNASAVVGVAPGAPLTGVKVLGRDGKGTWSDVIKGVDWVSANANKPAIANMSLSDKANKAVDQAVRNSAARGIFYSVCAGNQGKNACNYSPGRAGAGTNNGITTTAATNSSDGEVSSSNYGRCVDIWAPGKNILSTKLGGGTIAMSGTSMATPHVGGGGALYLSGNTGASPTTVESQLKKVATKTAHKSKDGRTIVREYIKTF
jgi:aqualysin 1